MVGPGPETLRWWPEIVAWIERRRGESGSVWREHGWTDGCHQRHRCSCSRDRISGVAALEPDKQLTGRWCESSLWRSITLGHDDTVVRIRIIAIGSGWATFWHDNVRICPPKRSETSPLMEERSKAS